MSWSVVPILGSRRRRDWKFIGFTANRPYKMYVNKGDAIILNDELQPVLIYKNTLKRAKRNKDYLWKLVKDKRKDME